MATHVLVATSATDGLERGELPTSASLAAQGSALVGGGEMLVPPRMQDWGALRPMLVSMIFSG